MDHIIEQHYNQNLLECERIVDFKSLVPVGEIQARAFAFESSDREHALSHAKIVHKTCEQLFRVGHLLVAEADEDERQVAKEPDDTGTSGSTVGLLKESGAHEGECDGAGCVNEEEEGK